MGIWNTGWRLSAHSSAPITFWRIWKNYFSIYLFQVLVKALKTAVKVKIQVCLIFKDILKMIILHPTGVTFPSGEMQQRLVRYLYDQVNISPEKVEYIEAHGTGTKVRF